MCAAQGISCCIAYKRAIHCPCRKRMLSAKQQKWMLASCCHQGRCRHPQRKRPHTTRYIASHQQPASTHQALHYNWRRFATQASTELLCSSNLAVLIWYFKSLGPRNFKAVLQLGSKLVVTSLNMGAQQTKLYNAPHAKQKRQGKYRALTKATQGLKHPKNSVFSV